MKWNINFNMEITFSKFSTLIISLFALLVTYLLDEPQIAIIIVPVCLGIFANRQYQIRKEHEINKEEMRIREEIQEKNNG